jgi:hypothetical protein
MCDETCSPAVKTLTLSSDMLELFFADSHSSEQAFLGLKRKKET